MAEQHITLSGDLAQLERLRCFVDRFGRENGLGEPLVFELNLALDELVTNIITHGGASPVSGIYISLRKDGDDLVVAVEDDGPAFDPCETKPPDVVCSLEERCIGGLGIHLVRSLTDAMCYERRGGRNRIILFKKAVPKCG